MARRAGRRSPSRRQPFRFLIGAPLYLVQQPAAAARRVGVALPRHASSCRYQFVAEILPYYLGDRYRWDAARAPGWWSSGGRTTTLRARRAAPDAARLPNGLRPGHIVTVDPGHGGVDPGNPGMFFPRGAREKDVTLQVSLLLRDELKRRGIGVRMTRTTDTLIALGDRGGYCTDDCDLFVSLHVNSLARRPGYTDVRGFETFFLAEAKTEDAARVAKMENDAVRFETGEIRRRRRSGSTSSSRTCSSTSTCANPPGSPSWCSASLEGVHTGESRGVKQAGFMVLTTARRPAILVELGYSTNPEDGRFLTTTRSQKAMAVALADAVVDYLLEYERKTGVGRDSGAGR